MKKYVKPTIIDDVVYVSDSAIASSSSTCYYCIDNGSPHMGNHNYIPNADLIIWDCEGAGSPDSPACTPI